MTIVHGVLSLDVGGLERIVLALARGQVRPGHAVTILCVEKPGTLAAEAEASGVAVVCLNKPPGRPATFASQVAAALKRLQPAVLHTHQIGAAYHLAPWARVHGIRTVHTEHGNAFARAGGVVERLKLRWLYHSTAQHIDCCACVSDDIATALTKWRTVSPAKVQTVPNGIERPIVTNTNVRQELGIPENVFVVGTVGRLNEVKQQHVLLQALARMSGVWALIVGDGPERASLEQWTRDLNIAERTVFTGYQSEPANYLNAMDVFTLTSRSEGLPVSLLEAWTLEKPVVCSAVGGLNTVVTSGVNGILVPAGDILEFTRQFEALKRDQHFAHEISEGGSAEFEKYYSFELMQGRYSRIYGAS